MESVLPHGSLRHSCIKAASTAVISICGGWNDYSLKYVRTLADLCNAGYEPSEIAAASRRVCTSLVTS